MGGCLIHAYVLLPRVRVILECKELLLIVKVHSLPLASLQVLESVLSIPKVIRILSLPLKSELVLAGLSLMGSFLSAMIVLTSIIIA